MEYHTTTLLSTKFFKTFRLLNDGFRVPPFVLSPSLRYLFVISFQFTSDIRFIMKRKRCDSKIPWLKDLKGLKEGSVIFYWLIGSD